MLLKLTCNAFSLLEPFLRKHIRSTLKPQISFYIYSSENSKVLFILATTQAFQIFNPMKGILLQCCVSTTDLKAVSCLKIKFNKKKIKHKSHTFAHFSKEIYKTNIYNLLTCLITVKKSKVEILHFQILRQWNHISQ